MSNFKIQGRQMKEFYMNLALNEAWKYQFLTYPNPAVGCVILDKNGKILAIKAHEKAGLAHAELNAITHAFKSLRPEISLPKEANALHEFICKNHQGVFKNSIAFVTLEPCSHQGKTPPCAKLFSELGFKKIFISVKDGNKIASGGAEFLKKQGIEVEFDILKEEGKKLLKPFLKWQKGQFKLFKLALSMNGSPFGKIVSNELSRTYAHKIRAVIDLLVVGGETIRKDHPILDARLCKAKAPNLCILSRQNIDNFDKNIPLFKVPNRQIYTQIPSEAKFLMYEGGENFLKTFKDGIDMFLIFQSSSLNDEKNVTIPLNFKPLYRNFLGSDTYGIYEL
ncbi:bifunctional diaminohydroxyphosphoribosylaminopyrimidine deaminase/5-amino-6-(5-phosphoribosylamino)uracil reductase RibD [Campylobacter jejuni]|uniref:bifunctional diaminohydroxyphosphoribosylaminopyrimidine deaminase/5-amino-6-(5-phosphoribosylamino)uracil reductase RibD n=1 Tax=Campylobacter jejuni TaxID=197 RepID=UPI0012CA5128|nr:bifunctional diaminohydroxyphosphoribosylaminopyrimidine deaminase/5-amino-6-(5-phosphoribosylamino)uracil reductase RibD [Campylobacter jejuni]ECK7599173.1 bifunctional diaminohydroxyphosphoribosylaminopyrimidine deaminase/5-amino-6-(5-phosphoribosylamino)uracil reductase RibD [Campylobacter jejuni]ECQ1038956.1 bifunctional diaminohydroxyphosphoribosylaminopyrimidine deaminase/5-amino-6-(5-phosphoribosylamino)uracil reductase RibD [Campylobacter jejuni]EDP7275999.1 bifunctional diaminohydrox